MRHSLVFPHFPSCVRSPTTPRALPAKESAFRELLWAAGSTQGLVAAPGSTSSRSSQILTLGGARTALKEEGWVWKCPELLWGGQCQARCPLPDRETEAPARDVLPRDLAVTKPHHLHPQCGYRACCVWSRGLRGPGQLMADGTGWRQPWSGLCHSKRNTW